MLAKAVAKESGSRMLEIQASDMYGVFVDKGNKKTQITDPFHFLQ